MWEATFTAERAHCTRCNTAPSSGQPNSIILSAVQQCSCAEYQQLGYKLILGVFVPAAYREIQRPDKLESLPKEVYTDQTGLRSKSQRGSMVLISWCRVESILSEAETGACWNTQLSLLSFKGASSHDSKFMS